MTIGRTDDPANPLVATACEAASVFGTGSRTPSGPAAMAPRRKAGHMIANRPAVRFLIFLLHPRGRPHMLQRLAKPHPCLGLDRGPHLGQRPWRRVERPDT